MANAIKTYSIHPCIPVLAHGLGGSHGQLVHNPDLTFGTAGLLGWSSWRSRLCGLAGRLVSWMVGEWVGRLPKLTEVARQPAGAKFPSLRRTMASCSFWGIVPLGPSLPYDPRTSRSAPPVRGWLCAAHVPTCRDEALYGSCRTGSWRAVG